MRPDLTENISIEDFCNFYWLKEELVSFCRQKEIPTSGSKIELAERIKLYLQTGQIAKTPPLSQKSSSRFDWNNALLSPDTFITDNYKNSENVREFFLTYIGRHFRFNTSFMQWMKENAGKTLADAATEWKRIYEQKQSKENQTDIAPQFEYNRYIRSFLADNPDKSLTDAIHYWKLKKGHCGDNQYSRSDFDLK